MSGTLDTLMAAWPMLWRAIRSGQLFRPQCDLYPSDESIVAEYDVRIPMPQGHYLTANVFRPGNSGSSPNPTVMCAHPYDNRKIPALKNTPFGGPPAQYRLIPQAGGHPRFSTLTSWESPDPGFWTSAGYNVVNLNLPGFANSGGTPTIFSEDQGQSFREAIQWVSEQPWSDGNIGLCGVSFLCISQYFAAAVPSGQTLPDALKCMIPWEGVSDLYHDLVCRGGVAATGLLNFWWHTEVKECINTPIEAYLDAEEAIPAELLDRHPFYDHFWQSKVPALDHITIPMLVGASFSDHELHTTGTFRAYEKASSNKKWLYTHRNGKWSEFYHPECLALQRRFMDHFLKGIENEFADSPYVRLEVRTDRDTIKEVRKESSWPLPQTQYQSYFLADNELTISARSNEAVLSYPADSGQASFDRFFDADTELSGYMMAKIWIEVRPTSIHTGIPDDAIVCCYVEKLDKYGNPLRFNGSVGSQTDVLTRGYCRASRRALDPSLSTPWLPVITGDRHQPLNPGDIVPLHIALCPSSTYFEAGEGLRLTLSTNDTVHAPIFNKVTHDNIGRHVIHFGGQFDSYLLVPRIPAVDLS